MLTKLSPTKQNKKSMKRTLLTLVAASAIATSQAQPTLTATNMNPVHGDVFYGHQCDTNVSKGSSGAHVTWNFTAVAEAGLDTTSFFACDSTAFCSSFPGSNIAAKNGGVYVYASATAAGLSMKGVHGMGTDIVYDNAQDVVRYPLTYNTVFTDTSGYANTVLGYYHTEIDSYICDGYGTLKLPGSTDTNTLRVHAISYTIDSIDLGGFTSVTKSRGESYMWYRPGFHNALFSISYDTAGSASGQPYVSAVTYYVKKAGSGTTTSVAEINHQPFALQVYPNPANDAVHLKFNLQDATGASITITDVAGRAVAYISESNIATGENDIAYQVSSLPSGLYIVRMQSSAGIVSKKVVISR